MKNWGQKILGKIRAEIKIFSTQNFLCWKFAAAAVRKLKLSALPTF